MTVFARNVPLCIGADVGQPTLAWGPLWGRLFRRLGPAESRLRAKSPAPQGAKLLSLYYASLKKSIVSEAMAAILAMPPE